MFRNSSTGSTRRIRSVHVVAAGAIVLAMSGSATAAMVITGKQIKDNSVTSKDIKNGSLLVKDFKTSEVAKLRGSTGATGATGATGGTGTAGTTGAPGTPGAPGAPGASAFAPPPSGTVIKGGGVVNASTSAAGVVIRDYAPLPFTAAAPFTDNAPANVHFGSTAFDSTLFGGQLDATACAGTAASPVPAAGQLCLYPIEVGNANSLYIYPGVDTGANAADRSGFYLFTKSVASGQILVRYVWAYKAP